MDLGDILVRREIKFRDLRGRIVAIDGYNALYQFLSTIRQPDGTPLRDNKGRVTSHLSGLFYRTVNYMAEGIKPVYVFDGKPPELKLNTLNERMKIRRKAMEEWQKAVDEGNEELARVKAQQASFLTREMVGDAKKLLDYMGIPWVQAPSEGEAQASYMAKKGDAYAAASQDYDSLLFGAPYLIRNMAITGRRKLPRKKMYVEIKPELINLEENLRALGITREQLIDMGILVGTDFNPGVKGIGAKTALKLLKKYGKLEEVMKVKEIEIENYKQIREFFLNPPVTDEYELVWKNANEEKIIEFMCEERDFSEERVRSALEKIEEFKSVKNQKSLDAWFN